MKLSRAIFFGVVASVVQAQARSNTEKVDIVTEAIDLDPIFVSSNSSGYLGSENKAYRNMFHFFAKAFGQNRVWRFQVCGMGTGAMLFRKDVTKSEGWHAKPGGLGGMWKADELKNYRKTTALSFVVFGPDADSR